MNLMGIAFGMKGSVGWGCEVAKSLFNVF